MKINERKTSRRRLVVVAPKEGARGRHFSYINIREKSKKYVSLLNLLWRGGCCVKTGGGAINKAIKKWCPSERQGLINDDERRGLTPDWTRACFI